VASADDRNAERSKPEVERQKRRRRAEVFGDVLPDSTRDDRDEESRESGDSDEWLRRQVPPHHGK
jgi:hypothetical protein